MLPAFKHITLSINVASLHTHNIFHMQCFNRQKALFLNGLLDQLYVHSMFQYGKTRRGKSLCDLSFDMLLLHSTVRVTVISCTWYVTHNALCAVHIYIYMYLKKRHFTCSIDVANKNWVGSRASSHFTTGRQGNVSTSLLNDSSPWLLWASEQTLLPQNFSFKHTHPQDEPPSLPSTPPPQPLSPHDADARGPLFSDHPCFTQTIHSLGRCSVTKTRLQAPSWQDCRHLHNCVCPFPPNRLYTDRWKNEILSHSDDLLAQSPLSPEAETRWSHFDTWAQSNVCFWSFSPQEAPWLHLSASVAAGQWSVWCMTKT